MIKAKLSALQAKMSFSQQYVAMVLLIVVVFVSILMIMMNVLLTTSYDRQIRDSVVRTSESIGQEVGAFVNGVYNLSYELAVSPSIRTMDGDIQAPILTDCISRNVYLELLYIQDINGDQTARSSGRLTNGGTYWWFQKMLAENRPFVSHSAYSVFTMRPSVSVYIPIHADRNSSSLLGVFAANIRLSYIQHMIEKFSDYQNGVYSFIIDGQGVVMAHPDSSYLEVLHNYRDLTTTISAKDEIGRPYYNENGEVATAEVVPFTLSESYQEMIRHAMAGNSGNGLITEDGTAWYVGYAPIELPGYSDSWSVITLHDRGAAMRVVNQVELNVLLITLGIAAIAVFIFVLLARRVARPMREIIDNANRIASGDYSSRITGEYSNEFAIVRDSMNTMASNVETYIRESDNSLNILTNILDGLDAYIYVTVPETGEILFINTKMKKHFNVRDDAVGQYCYKVLQAGMDERCSFCPCHQLDKAPDEVVVWEEHNTLTKRHYRNTDCYINWLGDVKVHLQHSVDITDIRKFMNDKLQAEREALELTHKKEQAEETSRMKSAFLAHMSHEIRTPMNGIIGFTELALDDTISPKTEDYLTKIRKSAESLLKIINDILDISKIEAGKIELEKIPFELSDVFKLCRTITLPKALEKGITLFCYAEPSVGRMLLGDPTRLHQVLLNLLSNAVKFTNVGMVKLLSAITESTENTVTVHFEVKDNGIGMTAEQIQKIFQPFVQADGSTTRKYGGTGLGLAITKNIVELMGGQLQVESALGLGSRFSFNLTFDTIAKTAHAPHAQGAADIVEKPIFNGEVLICEDNELNQQVICDHLTRVGLTTVVASNGKIGVDYVARRKQQKQKPFDLIFMDIHMPEMDGLEASRILSDLGSKTPIVALTANIMTNDQETYLAAGMSDCVSKPFTAHELWACLLRYLKPVGTVSANRTDEFAADEAQRLVLITNFVKGHQNTFADISDALASGDIKLAHRLAHTLKGVAGIVGMTMLQKAAGVIERSLAGGRAEYTREQMDSLAFELNAALRELAPLVQKNIAEVPKEASFDKEEALSLLSQLDLLLASDSFDSLNVAQSLSAIPGTELLVELVEDFKFKPARETLSEIKLKWERSDE